MKHIINFLQWIDKATSAWKDSTVLLLMAGTFYLFLMLGYVYQ